MTSRTRFITIALLATLYASPSYSQLYLGAATGLTDYGTLAKNVSSTEITAGLKFHDNFALETSWLELGETELSRPENTSTNFGIDGLNIGLVSIFPVADSVDVLAKFGLYYWDVESSNITSQTLIRSNGEEENTDIALGLGLAWELVEEVDLRIMYQQIDVIGDNIENISAGLTVSF